MARREVVASVAGPFPADLLADVQLVVSELVTNSVQHSGASPTGDIRLVLDVSEAWVRVAVIDPGVGVSIPRVPVGQPPGTERGRGLRIVERLVADWGWVRHPGDGLEVWAELTRP